MQYKVRPSIPWASSIWFFDVDDCLIDTAAVSIKASVGIKESLIRQGLSEERAKQVQLNFNEIFNLMLAGYRAQGDNWSQKGRAKQVFDKLLCSIKACQKGIEEKYGNIKKWSREVFIWLAAKKAGLSLLPEIVHRASDAYWLIIGEKAEVFPGVLTLIREIKKRHRPVFLVTSSDARLKLKQEGQFEYVPERSERLKRRRVELLREKGIEFDGLSIGDPEDKPGLDFFQKSIKIAEDNLGCSIDLANAIMVGDSFPADLQTPKEKMGFGLVVLFQKDKNTTTIEDGRYITTGNLYDITTFLDNV